jgi:hypothetical protein
MCSMKSFNSEMTNLLENTLEGLEMDEDVVY